MTNEFSQPSAPGSGDQFNAADHRGHLLLIYPKAYQPEVPTKNGPSSAADVDVLVVDKPGPDGKPLAFIGSRLFGNLANSVRNDVGGQVLGRLDQIQTQGGRTPWVLQSFSDQDAAMAGPVHAAYQSGQFKPTENPMAAPATAPQSYPPAAAPTPPAQQQWQQQAAPAQQQWQGQPVPAAPAPTPAVAPGGTWTPSTPPPPAASAAPYQAPPTAAPTPSAPAGSPGGTDPNLVAFLVARGVAAAPTLDQATCVAIGRSFQPDFGQQFPHYQ